MLLAEAILLFLRHPEPGRTKTRLIPALGPEGAADLYARLAERVADVVRALDRPGLDRIAYFEPADREAEIAEWMGEAFRPLAQPDADLAVACAGAGKLGGLHTTDDGQRVLDGHRRDSQQAQHIQPAETRHNGWRS